MKTKITRWCCLHEKETLESLAKDLMLDAFVYEDKEPPQKLLEKGRHLVRITLEIMK